ncbi:MAG TPA: bifunctional DNA primase/polymerase [Mycobacteriales bacterium]|nr:bifunctional DNA primase/polymerase [Mycobacteriales bacterium]
MRAWTSRRVQRALRQAASGYVERGWAVAPGAYLLAGRRADRGVPVRSHRCSCLRPACPAPGAHPIDPDWAGQATSRAAAVDWWWSSRPHGIVLPVGLSFDVLDVPGRVGPLALNLIRVSGCPVGPVARTPDGRWQFLSSPSGRSSSDFPVPRGVGHRGSGDFLLAPPSRFGPAIGSVWVCPPSAANRRLAPAATVTEAIESACAALPVPAATSARPRPRYLLDLAHIR